jgi:hypothetical protein
VAVVCAAVAGGFYVGSSMMKVEVMPAAPMLVPGPSYWAIYDGVKNIPPPECNRWEVGAQVPTTCCSADVTMKVSMNDFLQPAPTMCAAASFNEDGSGVRAFMGCVGDTVTYSENCREPGMDYPFPPGFDTKALTLGPVPTSHDCNCESLVGTGPGCFKANDFSSNGHNKYKDDPRSFYAYLSKCAPPAPTPPPPMKLPGKSYWSIYDGVKAIPGDECAIWEVGTKVPDSCCTDESTMKVSMNDYLNPMPTQCQAASFSEDGSGVRAFFGCVDDTVTYAENCRVDNMEYPFPPGFDAKALTLGTVPTPEDCGCKSLVGVGGGCFKANDFSTNGHNKFKDDPKHFYAFLSACE